jgi:hypothetical protein
MFTMLIARIVSVMIMIMAFHFFGFDALGSEVKKFCVGSIDPNYI